MEMEDVLVNSASSIVRSIIQVSQEDSSPAAAVSSPVVNHLSLLEIIKLLRFSGHGKLERSLANSTSTAETYVGGGGTELGQHRP